ncbi:MAG: hypothetical protein FD167_2526 [bacterium]|nr:MAG: hypothetical protein FD167_2526 [bacterium]
MRLKMTKIEHCCQIIEKVYGTLKQQQPQLTDQQTLKLISRKYYPFENRYSYSYKAWLKAVKRYRVYFDRLAKAGMTTIAASQH